MRASFFALSLLFALLSPSLGFGDSCPAPPPAANFSLANLAGDWFEIGKVQTFGGALIEGDCHCTKLAYAPTDAAHATVSNICNKGSADGTLSVANATIEPADSDETDASGAFEEKFCAYCPAVAYTIVALDETSMVEFDCSASLLGRLNYCFHVMSRTPTMDDATLARLKGLMDDLGLNPSGLEWKDTDQSDCWN